MDTLDKKWDFIKETNKLKGVSRKVNAVVGRLENPAEHSWTAALLCQILVTDFEKEFGKKVDLLKVMKMAIMHDLVEIYTDDVGIWNTKEHRERAKLEDVAAEKIFSFLPSDVKTEFLALWEEFENGETLEAKIVRGVERLTGALQRLVTGQGWKEVNGDIAHLDGLILPRVKFSKVLMQLYGVLKNEAIAKGLLDS